MPPTSARARSHWSGGSVRFQLRAAANAETLWLGVKVERKLNNRDAVSQLGNQLQSRFPQSREAIAYERGNFND